MSRPAGPRVLVARGVDGLLVGWLAVLVWLAYFGAQKLGLITGSHDLPVVYWIGAVVTAAHFGLSYHLAYSGGPPAMRARPLALIVGPAVLIAVLGAVVIISLQSGAHTAARATTALITSVYLLTTWHYIKQVYGVGRVGAAFAGVSLSQWDVRVLRFGLYPLWFLGAAQVLVQGGRYNLAGYTVGFEVLPNWTYDVFRVVAVCSALPVAVVFATIARRTRRVPSLLAAPYVAAFLWLGLPTDPWLTLLLLAPFHALQYLAVGHRAEVAVAADRPGEHGVLWWLNIFAGAACGGLLLSRWVPQFLDAHVRAGHGAALFTAAFFVFLNIHHYLIDASIWRSKGELVKAMVRKPAAPPAPAASAPELVSGVARSA